MRGMSRQRRGWLPQSGAVRLLGLRDTETATDFIPAPTIGFAPPVAGDHVRRYAPSMADIVNASETRPESGASSTGGAPTSRNWMGVTSLITALLGLSLVAIVTGHLGLKAARRGQADNRSIARAGTIVGYLGLGLSLAAITLGIFAFVDARRYQQDDLAQDDAFRLSAAVFDAWADPASPPEVSDGYSGFYEIDGVAAVARTARMSTFVYVMINPNDLSDKCVSIQYSDGKKYYATVSSSTGFSNESCPDLGYDYP